VRHVANINTQNSIPNENYFLTFASKLSSSQQQMQKLKEELLNHIFDWQMKIKHDEPQDARINHFEEQSVELAN
jgi:hypothetical protein